MLEGAGNLLGIAADPIGQTIDYLAPREHDLSSLMTGEAPRYQRAGESASQLADWIGLPKPEGSLEEGVGNASRALVGTGLMMGGGLAAGAPQMAAQPLSQAASTLTGSAAQEIAKARGATEGEQTLAALAGGLGPSVAAAAGGAALRGAVRGGEQGRQAMQSTIDAFRTAGTTPTVGQATEGRTAQALESLLARVPGSAGVMAKFAGNPSVQNELGDVFSMESFLTNWNKLSGAAKQVLFDRMGPTFRNDLDQIAKAASNVRDGSMVFRNPSGTAGAATQATTAATAVTALLSGHYGTAAGIGAGVGAANLSARLMTNPTFVRWLARQTTVPIHALPFQVSVLANMADHGNDSDLGEAAQLFGSTMQ